MIEPLYGPQLKVARANRHISDLESLLYSFVCDNPCRVIVEDRPNGGQFVKVDLGGKLPSEIPTIIGDAVHNLRVALDHLACDMVRHNGTEPGRHHGFPIHPDQSNFMGQVRSKLAGATDECINFVIDQKPYCDNGGNRWIFDLATIDNDDKHIILTPTFRISHIRRMVVKNHGVPVFTGNNIAVGGDGTINLLSLGLSNPEYETAIDEPPTIIFGNGCCLEGRPLVPMLRKLSSGVAEIISEAKALF